MKNSWLAVISLMLCLCLVQTKVLWADDESLPLNNPEITHVSRTPSSSPNVIAQGNNYIYYGDGSAIAVYDPDDMALLNRISIPLDASPGEGERAGMQGIGGVFYAAGRLYAACGNAGLQIYDVSVDPVTPTWQSTYIVYSGEYDEIRARAKDVFVVEDYAYIVYKVLTIDGHRTGIQVLDVSDPANPVLMGECGTPSTFELGLAGLVEREQSIVVHNDQAYITDYSNGLAVYDVSDPADPTHEAWTGITYALDITISGDRVYVVVGGYGLWIYPLAVDNDIPNDSLMVEAVCQYNQSLTLATSLEIFGNYVYIADNRAGLVVIDVSNPAAIDTTAEGYQAGDLDGMVQSYGVDMSGAYCVQVNSNGSDVYLGNRINGLQKITVGIPDNASTWSVAGVDAGSLTSGSADVDAFALDKDFETDKSYAYVVDDDSTAGGNQEGFYVYYARFAADWIDFFYKGFLATDGEARDVYVVDDYAYVADGSQGLKVIDPGLPGTDADGQIKVEERANPQLVGSCSIGAGSAARLKVYGGYAYIAAEDGGLRVVDVAEPEEPEEVGGIAGTDVPDARSVDIGSTYAYVAGGRKGLQVVDVVDPADPVLLGICELPGIATDVSLVGNRAYVACRQAGKELGMFDGAEWQSYSSVIARDVDVVCVDETTHIAWLGTDGRGVQLFDIINSAWLRSYTTADGLAGSDVEAVAFDGDGRVWCGTSGDGVSVFDGAGWTTYTSDGSGLAGNDIEVITIDASGTIVWIGTQGNGISRYDTGSASWTTYDTSNSELTNNEIEGITIDSSGNLWIATDGGGVCKFDMASWTVYDDTVSGLPYNQIEAIAVDRYDHIWVGSETQIDDDGTTVTVGGGISMYDGSTWTNYTTDNSGLCNDRVITIAVDDSGATDILWFGTYGGGVSRCEVVDPEDDATWSWTTYNTSNGLSHDYVQDIAADNAGHVWLAFLPSGGGIYEVNISDPENPEWVGDYRDADYNDIVGIYAAVSDEDPNVDLFWVANGEKGLGYFSNPKSVPLTQLKTYNSTGFVKQVRAFGSFAVLAEGAGGLQVAGVDPAPEGGDDAWKKTVPTDLSRGSSSGCFVHSVSSRRFLQSIAAFRDRLL